MISKVVLSLQHKFVCILKSEDILDKKYNYV